MTKSGDTAKAEIANHSEGNKGRRSKTRLHKRKNDGDQHGSHEGNEKKQHKRIKREKDDSRVQWSKSKKKRMRQQRAQVASLESSIPVVKDEGKGIANLSKTNETDIALKQRPQRKSALQKAFEARLSGSRFRILNEELYTIPSSSAFHRFKSNPELYEQYHEGFRYQVDKWPQNPVNVIVRGLKKMSSARRDTKEIVVADFGCGDAELAKQLLQYYVNGSCPFKVHSFDLVASCDLVTACDMAKVPLSQSSVDVAVFCLSLMGTNLADFIREAHRVLKADGCLTIAEVRSRFESKSEKDEITEFISVLDSLGFSCSKTDKSNKLFFLLDLCKNGKKPNPDLVYTARPCIYKRR